MRIKKNERASSWHLHIGDNLTIVFDCWEKDGILTRHGQIVAFLHGAPLEKFKLAAKRAQCAPSEGGEYAL